MAKLKLSIETILLNDFAPAFDAICGDTSIPMKDRYGLGRSMRDIQAAMGEYEKQRTDLVKKFGEPEAPMLKRQIEDCTDLAYLARLRSKTQRMEQFDDTRFLAALKSKLAYLENNNVESWAIDCLNEENIKSFRDKLIELQKVEFELYLDHKVKLGDKSNLNAKDISTLIDLIEVD